MWISHDFIKCFCNVCKLINTANWLFIYWYSFIDVLSFKKTVKPLKRQWKMTDVFTDRVNTTLLQISVHCKYVNNMQGTLTAIGTHHWVEITDFLTLIYCGFIPCIDLTFILGKGSDMFSELIRFSWFSAELNHFVYSRTRFVKEMMNCEGNEFFVRQMPDNTDMEIITLCANVGIIEVTHESN